MPEKSIERADIKLWSRNFVFLTLSAFGVGFLYSLFSSTLPIYVEQLTGTTIWAGAVSGIFSLSSVAIRPIAGVLCTKFDKIKLCIIGLIMMTTMAFLYSWVSTILLLLLMRVIHGIGFGLKGTASGVAVVNILPRIRVAEGIAIYGAYVPLCSIIGPALGLEIIGKGTPEGFNTLFLVAGAIGVASTLLMLGVTKDGINRDISMPGTKYSKGDSLPKTYFGFERGVAIPSIILFLVYMGQGCVVSFIALYCIDNGWGTGGSFFVISASAQFLSRLINSKTIRYIGYDRSVISGIVLYTVGIFLIPFSMNLDAIRLAGAIIGLGIGFIPASINAIMFERCSVQRRGSVQAAFASSLDLGLAGGAIGLSFVLQMLGYKIMFTTAACLALIAGIIYMKWLWGNRKEFVANQLR